MNRLSKPRKHWWLRTDDPDALPNPELRQLCPLTEKEVRLFYRLWAQEHGETRTIDDWFDLGWSLTLMVLCAATLFYSANGILQAIVLFPLVLLFPLVILFYREHSHPKVAWNSRFAMTRAIKQYLEEVDKSKQTVISGIQRDIESLKKTKKRIEKAEAKFRRKKSKNPTFIEQLKLRWQQATGLSDEIDFLLIELQKQLEDNDRAITIVRQNLQVALASMGPGDASRVLNSARTTLATVGKTPSLSQEIKSLATDVRGVRQSILQLNARYRSQSLDNDMESSLETNSVDQSSATSGNTGSTNPS